MLAALISVLTGTGNVLLDKFLLTRQKMNLGSYIALLFGFVFLITLVTLPWTGSINTFLAIDQQYIFYFILMVMLAILHNIFYYEGLQKKQLVEFEMILLLTPLVTVVMSTLFFPEEFSGPIFAAAIIGSFALLFSSARPTHFHLDKQETRLVLAVILMAMETMVQRELLMIYSPTLLYTIRTGFLAAFFAIYYKPNLHQVTNQQFNLVFLTALIGAISVTARFYGYQMVGITFTTLILLLMPILASWADAQINGSRIKKRTLIAFTVILLCVVYAILQS